VRAALDDEALREAVRERFAEARRDGVTGVPTLEYAPYYLFAFLSPLVLFAMAGTGLAIGEGTPDRTVASADD